ncbi:hypothetical protein CEXT_608341 [Caerostris extrusa]|uniref:Uncharacterized protein n=1 Tax=Caerostris extrusa TaxID=172846 RepID=A0AAV4T8A8_CAEEX|nr:hypothetical protein CEXT_608341 [Caerostris extrusa]
MPRPLDFQSRRGGWKTFERRPQTKKKPAMATLATTRTARQRPSGEEKADQNGGCGDEADKSIQDGGGKEGEDKEEAKEEEKNAEEATESSENAESRENNEEEKAE